MEKKTIYLMPGMAASSKIFELLEFPKYISVKYLNWIQPFKEEELNKYAYRMSLLIKCKNPILIGVSLGGVLVQEISKIIKCHKVVIISSVKSKSELPISMKMAKHTGVHKLLPLQWIKNVENLINFVFGDSIKIKLYKKYLSRRDPEYLAWAFNALVNWKQEEVIGSIVHIHGIDDNIFPIGSIDDPVIKVDGSHAIILTQAKWFNKNLPKLI